MALISALAAVPLAGCGLEAQPFSTRETTSTAAEADAIVTKHMIGWYPPRSPEAAAMRWWRAIQTRDLEAVTESYSPEARKDLPRHFSKIVTWQPLPVAQASITIEDVDYADVDKATVNIVLDSADQRLDGPLALPMRKDGDESKYQVADTLFADRMAEAYQAAVDSLEGTTTDAAPPAGDGK